MLEPTLQTQIQSLISTAFAGKSEVHLAEVGELLLREGIQYKQLGYDKLRPFLTATGLTLTERFPAPGAPAVVYVQLHAQEKKTEALPCSVFSPMSASAATEPPSASATPSLSPDVRAQALSLIHTQFAGRPEVPLAEVGVALRTGGVDYKLLGYDKLRTFAQALDLPLEARFPHENGPAVMYLLQSESSQLLSDPRPLAQTAAAPAPAAPIEPALHKAHTTPKLFDFAFLPLPKLGALTTLTAVPVKPLEHLIAQFEQVKPFYSQDAAWFDTGLTFAVDNAPIYAYFERNTVPDRQPWFFLDFRHDPSSSTPEQATALHPAHAVSQRPAHAQPRRVAPGRALEAFAYMGNWTDTLQTLAQKALPENWDFEDVLNSGKQTYQILRSYLCYTFYRLQTEDKVRINPEHTFAAFHTGLVTPSYDDLYACFEPNHSGQSPWQLTGFCRAGERGIGKRLTDQFKPLPLPASYFTDLRDLLYETQLTPIVDYEHIILDNLARLPLSFIRIQCYDASPEVLSCIDAVEHSDRAHRKAAYSALSTAIGEHQALYNRIRNRLRDAIELAIKRVGWNYKTAIPMFYPRGNTMSLLLPLCLNNDQQADVALVVQRMRSGNYQGQTILTLPQAYLDARLVCRPDSDWLRTDEIVSDGADDEED